MALLQITEPGQSTAPHQHRLAAGIDLGTTNSLVATVRNGIAETIEDDKGRYILPSVVRYMEGPRKVQVGYSALDKVVNDPLNTVVSVKRLMGRGVADVKHLGSQLPYHFVDDNQGMPRLQTVAGDVSPVEVSAEILKVLSHRCEQALGGNLTGVVITVPAYFDDAQRQATKDAAKLAGLHVLRFLSEPTAAALAYGLDSGDEGIIAVYDLGGGTFDISILRLHQGVFEVLSTGGDTALGGDDFDRAIATWIMEQAEIKNNVGHAQLNHLMEEARKAKVKLSDEHSTNIKVNLDDDRTWESILSRDQLEGLIAPLVNKTLIACKRALRDADIDEGIDNVIMVGGSTRIPLVRQIVGELFGREPLVEIDPEKVVSIGAAIQADILAGNRPSDTALLLDVTPLSLGIETMGSLLERIIPRNTTIPVARAQEFTTFKDGQTAMSIHVLQGERESVDACRSLARFELHGIPPMVAGAARILVTYQVDADGLLTVSAREKTTGIESHVEVKPSYGLDDTEIAQMLKDSMLHADEDAVIRRLRECQVESKRQLEAIASALQEDGDTFLSKEERTVIEEAMQHLKEVSEGEDVIAIRQAMQNIENSASEYISRRMNACVKEVLAGKNVSEYLDEE